MVDKKSPLWIDPKCPLLPGAPTETVHVFVHLMFDGTTVVGPDPSKLIIKAKMTVVRA